MRRIDILKSISNVQNLLKNTGMYELISELVAHENKISPATIIGKAQDFYKFYSELNNDEKRIITILGLDDLHNANFWAKTLPNGERNSKMEVTYPIYSSLNFVQDNLGKLIDIFKQDNSPYIINERNQVIPRIDNDKDKILTVILPENIDNVLSKPDRLIKVLSSIDVLYKVVSEINGYDGNDLSVLSIDSGSDKSFDFIGIAKAVDAVKELIINLWDKVVFYREKKLHERMELISKSIPLVTTINDLEKDKKLIPEQAELFRRDVLNGINDFLSAGAVLPEFSQHNSYNPRQLMSPEPKLLSMSDLLSEGNSESTIVEEDINEESSEEEFSEEERALLQKLAKKEAKSKKKDNKKSS